MEQVLEYAKELIADGYSLINLCGDFNEEHIAELMTRQDVQNLVNNLLL